METTKFNEIEFRKKVEENLDAYLLQMESHVEFFNQAAYELQGQFLYPNSDGGRTFRLLNEILTNAAGISHLLWPGAARNAARAKMAEIRAEVLRSCLLLTGTDHPLHDRSGRDHLAHLDERIDDWVATSQKHNIAMRSVGPKGRMMRGLDEREIFEQFDPETFTFHFRGNAYVLPELTNGVRDIRARITKTWFDRRNAPMRPPSGGAS